MKLPTGSTVHGMPRHASMPTHEQKAGEVVPSPGYLPAIIVDGNVA
jgi:hypothetical protein